jgi:hypothetical protein
MTKKAKRPARPRKKKASAPVRRTSAKRSVKRPTRKAQPAATLRTRAKKKAPAKKAALKKATPKKATPKKATPKKAAPQKAARPAPRLERPRRTLDDTSGPPSSLDMVRKGSAVRSARVEIAESLRDHRGMSQDITGGDLDVDVEDAYFNGDEAPGGDNPTPDQDIVDDIGRALGVEYQDNEELKPVDKVEKRDKHRWELDPASAEDYKDRK